jgi:hypothetical protein
MADIAQLLSNAAQTNANFNFDDLINKPAREAQKSDFAAQDQAAKNALRDVFKNGVPTTADGQPDFAAMGKALFQSGDVGQGVALSNLDIQRQGLQQNQEGARFSATGQSGNPQPTIVSPPSVNRSGSAVVAQPLARGGTQPQGNQQGGTLMQVLAAQGIPNDQLGAATASIGRQLGLQDPNQPLNLQDPQVRNVLVPAIQRLKQGGIGQVVPAPQGQPQAQPQGQPQPVAQQQPQVAPQAQQAPNPFANAQAAGLIPPGVDPARFVAGMKYRAAALPKGPAQEAIQAQVNAIDKASELTAGQRDFNASQANPAIDERAAQQKADEARATGVAQSDIKEQDGIISAGAAARQRLATLNTISNIIDTDKNMTLGFGAETSLKIKKALESIGVNVGDLSGPQAIQKLNGLLASESAKGVSVRPAQFEFKTFLTNNPGLDLDKAGNQRVIGIFSQLAKRDVDLGKLARQNRDNWQNWDNVVENYDKQNPIKDPVSGKVITTNSIVAPGPSKSTPASSPTFSSPADVHAAVASGKLKSGDAFKTSDGRTKYVP